MDSIDHQICQCGNKPSPIYNDDRHYCCINIRCDLNHGDKCPMCNRVNCGMGDDPLLYDCDKCNFIWSYHHDCPEISNPSITPSEFIGHLLYDDEFISCPSVEDIESNDNFVKSTPYNVEYEDCSQFVWKCSICREKYVNMYCG